MKQLQKRKKVVNQIALTIKQVTCTSKLIKKPSDEPFLGTTCLIIVISNPEVMSSIIGDDLILLFTEQANLP
jgi:hypothetical protein